MNFWVKTVKGDKITRDCVVRNDLVMTMNNVITVAQEVCHNFDIPTPIISKSQYNNLDNFNFMKFRPRDFVETVDFDYLLFEYFIDK